MLSFNRVVMLCVFVGAAGGRGAVVVVVGAADGRGASSVTDDMSGEETAHDSNDGGL